MTSTLRTALDEINLLTDLVVDQNGLIASGELDPRDAAVSDEEAATIAAELPSIEINELRWALQMLLAAHERRHVAAGCARIMKILAGP